MLVGKVVGNLVATRKDERLVGSKLLLVKTGINIDGNETDTVVAIDTVGAGKGEKVLLVMGSSARVIMANNNVPVDAAIVGIVDSIDIEE